MVPVGCSETSVRNYHYLLRNDPEERSSYLLRSGSLKSPIGVRVLENLAPVCLGIINSCCGAEG